MEEMDNKDLSPDGMTAAAEQAEETEETLSIADSVKTLSPGRMVMKRFFRSKLSVVGLVTLIVLFLFSFVGPELKFHRREQDLHRHLRHGGPQAQTDQL